MDDKGEIYPIEDVDKTLQKLTNTIRDSICPDITFFIKYDIEDNKILRIVVNEGSNKPYFLKDKGLIPAGVYVRQGSSSVQASYENIKQMIKLTDGISFEDERSLNQEITFKDAKFEFENKNLEFEEINKISLGIKNKDNLYTNLGLLVSNECPFSVKVAVFEDTEKMKFRKNQKGEDLYDIEATIYCLRNSHKGIIIGKNGEMLKKIGRAARIDMEENFRLKVNLKTWVKVKEDWQDNNLIVNKFKLK